MSLAQFLTLLATFGPTRDLEHGLANYLWNSEHFDASRRVLDADLGLLPKNIVL